MPTGLAEIVAATRQWLTAAKRRSDPAELGRAAERHTPRGFRRVLERASAGGVAMIAELKKASPSRGLIRGDFPVGRLASQLERAGAAALSVLTEQHFFQGSLANLNEASTATHLPCLRKDFILDPFQLLEARANRADAVLLILAALTDAEFAVLHHHARELGLDMLCEVHDQNELKRALDNGAEIIGVNNRDLKTFHVDVENALRIVGQIPSGVLRVAESGIRSGEDLRRLRAAGYQAFLVGESLMKAENPGEELSRLIAEAQNEVSSC